MASIDMVIRSIREFDHHAAQELITEFVQFDALHGRQIEVVVGDSRVRGNQSRHHLCWPAAA